jgi:hypothetical protein
MLETTTVGVGAAPNLTITNSTPTAAITGTIQSGAASDETDIVSGGSTIVVTLTGDTWVVSDGTDGTNANDYLIATADAILDGIGHVSGDDDVADIIAAAKADVTNTDNDSVIRTSATVLTITLPAVSGYAIGADEVISLTVPASMLETTTVGVGAAPNLTITNTVPTIVLTGTIESGAASDETDIVSGGSTIVVTLTGDTWVGSDGTDGTNANDYLIATADAILDGIAHVSGDDDVADIIAAAKADVTNTDNDAVVRTSATVLTITLPAVSGYAIGADEVISLTVPASMLETTTVAVGAAPNLTITNSATAPTITSVTADDPDDADALYSSGDTITFVFSENTNEPYGPNPTQGNLDTMFGAMNLGTTYTGTWTDAQTLTITVTDSTGGTEPTLGVTTYTLQAAGNLKNAAGTSTISLDTSGAIGGDWGTLAGPTITSVTADDPDDLDAVYGNDDTITFVFSENTNEPFGPNPTQGNLDTMFGAMNLGTTYSGTWTDAQTLTITVTNATGGTEPTLGVTTYTLQAAANLKNAANTSLVSTDTSAAITGNWGIPAPTITSVTADDPDNLDAVYGNDDTITIVFSENTNEPYGPNPTQGNLDTMFGAMNLGTTYSGTWTDAQTLTITITNATGGTEPTIGVTTYTLQAAGNLKNAAGTSPASTDTSGAIAGDWGTLYDNECDS